MRVVATPHFAARARSPRRYLEDERSAARHARLCAHVRVIFTSIRPLVASVAKRSAWVGSQTCWTSTSCGARAAHTHGHHCGPAASAHSANEAGAADAARERQRFGAAPVHLSLHLRPAAACRAEQQQPARSACASRAASTHWICQQPAARPLARLAGSIGAQRFTDAIYTAAGRADAHASMLSPRCSGFALVLATCSMKCGGRLAYRLRCFLRHAGVDRRQ